MDWIRDLNSSIDYIEENLDKEIEFDTLAKLAKCSTYHYQRMFSYMAGVPLSEYIRRRRMTKAAYDLQNIDEKVIDIGLKYGYNSPTAFNRAFKNIHGINPTDAKKKGIVLKSYQPISFKINIIGREEIEYKIVDKDEFKLIGVKKTIDNIVEKSFLEVPNFWQETFISGVIPKIGSMIDQEPFGIIGMSIYNMGDTFDYYIGAITNKYNTLGLEEYYIDSGTWAVFSGEGKMPMALQELQTRIVTEWMPNSDYEYDKLPDIEVYLNDKTEEIGKFEVWIPIIKK